MVVQEDDLFRDRELRGNWDPGAWAPYMQEQEKIRHTDWLSGWQEPVWPQHPSSLGPLLVKKSMTPEVLGQKRK